MRGQIFSTYFFFQNGALWPFVNLTDTKASSSLLETTHRHG